MENDLEPAGISQGHERTDAEVKPILIFLVALAALLLIVMLLMTGFYNILSSHKDTTVTKDSGLVDSAQIPHAPQLQPNPALDLKVVRERERQLLHSYGWIDKTTGTFRIPIERAMAIIARDGLPARTEMPKEQTK